MDTLFLNEHGCVCGKLLFKGVFLDGTLEIKCKNCGTINKIGKIKLEDDGNHYLLIVNNEGLITNVSDSACTILGYSSNELINKHFTLINPTLTKEIGEKFFGKDSMLDGKNHFQLDTFHKTKEGQILPVTIFLKLYKVNSKSRFVLLSVKLRRKIGEKENKLENKKEFVNNTCDFNYEIDRDARITYICPKVEKIFEFTQEMVIGKKHYDVLPEDIKKEAKNNFDHFSAIEQPYRRVNNIGIFLNHKKISYELYFTPNFDELFAKKIHTEQICVKKSDGNEVCINGDQVQNILDNNINSSGDYTSTSDTVVKTQSSPIEDSASVSETNNLPILDTPPVQVETSVVNTDSLMTEKTEVSPFEEQPTSLTPVVVQ